MASRVSVKAQARAAISEDKRARKSLTTDGVPQASAVTLDSFVNFAHKLGVGAENATSYASYGFNPITRNRILLEWIYRGSWLGGMAVNIIADDMTRRGVEIKAEIPPAQVERIEKGMTAYGVWDAINETLTWGRLYGGAIAVALLDGHDPKEPLRPATIGPGQFKGLLTLDRWMVEPSLEDLVTDYGPHLGLPKYYRVTASAPAMRGAVVHYSRVLVRHCGIRLPYQQRLQEQLWGISVLERLYDRMIAFDSATTGAAQLVYKSYLRTLSVDGLREIVGTGGKPLAGLTAYVDMMRRFQGIEGITMIDMKDKFEAQGHSAFSGLSDVITQFGQQISGALQIPLVRLFGQSPAGLNSSGESDLRTYYDHVSQLQQRELFFGVTLAYMLMAKSQQVALSPDFSADFRSLRELDDNEKGTIAKSNVDTVTAAYDSGLIGQKTAMQELKASSRTTGVFTNITTEMINKASDDLPPPEGQMEQEGAIPGLPGMPPLPGQPPKLGQPQPGLNNGNSGSQGPAQAVDQIPRRRVPLQQPAT